MILNEINLFSALKYITNTYSLIAYAFALLAYYFYQKNKIDRKKIRDNPTAYIATAEKLHISFEKIPEKDRAKITLKVLKNRISLALITAISFIISGLIIAYIVTQNHSSFSIHVIAISSKAEKIEERGFITLFLSHEPIPKQLDDFNSVTFDNIPSEYLNTKVRFGIKFTENYVLISPDAMYSLTDNETINLKIELRLNNHIQGTVSYNERPLSGVTVNVNGHTALTNESGYYSIMLPLNGLLDEEEITFTKHGFRLNSKRIFLQTLTTEDIVMQK
jgi:hypothetical protein